MVRVTQPSQSSSAWLNKRPQGRAAELQVLRYGGKTGLLQRINLASEILSKLYNEGFHQEVRERTTKGEFKQPLLLGEGRTC